MNKLIFLCLLFPVFAIAQNCTDSSDTEYIKICKSAGAGDAIAQFILGRAYATGKGVKQDDQTAVQWFQKAADQGSAGAQYNLGIMYVSGRGVRQDKSMAKDLFGKACDGGMQDGCDSYKKLNEEGVQ